MAEIKVYALSTCPYCKKAKALLKDLGADFEAVDVDLLPKDEQNAILDNVKKLADKCKPKVNPGFPTIVRDNIVIVGFNEAKIREMVFIPHITDV